MEIVALLSKREEVAPEVKGSLKRFTLYSLKTIEELEELYSNIPISLIIIDTLSYKLSSLEGLLLKLDEDMVILIVPEKTNKSTIGPMPNSIYDCVGVESIKTELPLIVERAIERRRFKNELRLLRQAKGHALDTYIEPPVEPLPNRSEPPFKEGISCGGLLISFAKMLTAGFDIQKLFNHFMDSVMEIVRVSKMSVMLKEADVFCIKTHYGIDPRMAENIRLSKDSALVTWLARHGRVIQKPLNPVDPFTIDIKKEMEILQCSLSFPMIYNGRLNGIFNINDKITNEPFYKEELEIIYVLCNYLAIAVKDIDLYHQIWYQKEFIQSIISSMNSGMIAIDRNEKITIFNQQAGEILNLDPLQVRGNDSMSLPSPLGDILYETMVKGTLYRRYEVEVPPSGRPLGVNSYRLFDKQQNPIGAGIIFSDISDSKKVEEQIKKSGGLEAVNKLMAQIAHEIRNPLTAIQTYTQLINEKYTNDTELRDFYTSSVSKSIQKLDTLMDRLITFTISNEPILERTNIATLIKEIEEYIAKNIKDGYNFIKEEIESSLMINADRRLLVKAVYYIIAYVISKTETSSPLQISAKILMSGLPSLEIRVVFEGEEITKEERDRFLRHLTDIENLETELNIPISYNIIKGHNGSLNILSEEGKNIFVINVPVIDRRCLLNEPDR